MDFSFKLLSVLCFYNPTKSMFMKKFFLALLIFCFTTFVQAQQNFEIKPQKPVPGSVITFEWLTRNTLLQGKQDIEGTAYLLTMKDLPLAVSIPLKKEGGIVTGSVKTNDSTLAVFFSFSKDDITENNNDAGYYTILYNKAGKEIMGGNLALATAFNSYGGIWRLKRDADKASTFYKKEFANPLAKEQFATAYLSYLAGLKSDADKEIFKEELAKLSSKKDISETDLMTVRSYYENTLKNKDKAEELTTQLKQRFPNGLWKRSEALKAFYNEKDAYQKAKLFEDVKKNFIFTKEDQPMLDSYASQLAYSFADTSDFENMKKFAAAIQNNTTKAMVYNNVAWKLAGAGIYNKPINAELGKQLSLESLDLMKKEMKEKNGKPVYQTDEQYVKGLEGAYYNYADTYAVLLYHTGEYEKAYDIQKTAVDHYKRKNANLNTSFTTMIEKIKGKQAARDEIEKFFEEGKYTPAMKNQFKAIFMADNKTEEDWVKYTNDLEVKALNRLKEALAKEIINMPAPQFALRDLDGKEISLTSLKGKVVVADFWATWCGPCIASFPAMKKAVEKFKNHPEVAFVFIDTWENDEDRKKKVTDFIAQNKYPFQVLYDQPKSKEKDERDFVVVAEYKVEGIPTKFVIDRNSNIRFKSVGWGGNADELVNELTAMIDLAASESGEPLKKAF